MILLTIPSVVYGSFANEYIRFSLMIATAAFTFFSAIHFFVRLIVSLVKLKSLPLNVLMILLIEYFLWRELMYQVGCYGKDKCDGEASFGQLAIHKALLISKGTILEKNRIALHWVWILWVRVMLTMFVHFSAFLNVLA